MTYRDDRDALLARADALEREADQLRRENERLREVPPPPPDVPSSELALSLSLQRDAHGPDAVLATVMIFIMLIGLVLASRGALWSGLAVVAGMCALVGVTFAISIGHRTRLIASEQAWIDAAPLGLDPAAYRRLLSEHHLERRITARIAFATPPAEDDRRHIAAEIPSSEVRWLDDHLVVASPRFDTVRAGSAILHDNAAVHGWVRDLVTALQAVASGHPIASLTIEDAR